MGKNGKFMLSVYILLEQWLSFTLMIPSVNLNKLNKITSLSRRSTAPHTRERPSKKEKLENTVKVLKNLFSITNLFSNSYVMMLVIVSNSLEMMLENSINLMVQPEFSPVNCPL